MKLKLTADNIFQQLTELAKAYAEASADAERLEKYEKILFSELVLRSSASSIAGKEHEARASQEFKDHIDGLRDARRKAIEAKCAHTDAHAWLDWKRTEAATERAALRSAP